MSERPRLSALVVGAATAILALLVAHGRVTPYNNYVLFADALLHGQLYIDASWPGPAIDAVLFDGHRYIVNDPVPALFALPLVFFFGRHANETFLACVLCGVAAGAAWRLFELLDVAAGAARWLLLFALLGTDLLWCSMLGDVWFIAQTSAVAFTFLMLVELAGARRGWLVGLFFALAVGSRFTLVMAAPVVLWWCRDGFFTAGRRPAALRGALLALAPCAALWVAYNLARWHVPWDAGHTIFYHEDPYLGTPAGSPFGIANVPMQLWSFFVQPPAFAMRPPYVFPLLNGTALTWTSPAFLLAFVARRPKRLVLSLWAAAVLVAVPSFLYYVNGGAQFGMRHVLDFAPFLIALMGLSARDRLGRLGAFLIAWSAIAGVYGCWFWNAMVRNGM